MKVISKRIGNIKINKELIYFMFLILYLFYYSYRYIFKYNSTGTSSTYSNTPAVFQYGKFAFMALFLLLLAKNAKKIFWTKRTKIVFYSIIYLIISGTILGLFLKNTDHLKFVIMLVPVLFFCDQAQISDEKFERIMDIYFLFCVIYEGVQIFLYIATGRLPALAYPTGKITDVRFGGAIDDPNGFGLILCYYIPYYFLKDKGIKRIIMLSIAGIMLILSWSVTAVFAVVLSGIILTVLCYWDRILKNNVKMLILFMIFLGILIMAVFGPKIIQTMQYFISNKQGSIQGHQDSWNFSKVNILTFFGLNASNIFSEVGMLRLFYNGGIPTLITFCYLGIYSINLLLAKAKSMPSLSQRAFYYGLCTYQISFFIEMFNLPVVYLFTNVGLYLMILVLALSQNNKEMIGES